jgi:hypothetical protein
MRRAQVVAAEQQSQGVEEMEHGSEEILRRCSVMGRAPQAELVVVAMCEPQHEVVRTGLDGERAAALHWASFPV